MTVSGAGRSAKQSPLAHDRIAAHLQASAAPCACSRIRPPGRPDDKSLACLLRRMPLSERNGVVPSGGRWRPVAIFNIRASACAP